MSDAASRVRFNDKDDSDDEPGFKRNLSRKTSRPEDLNAPTLHEAAENGSSKEIARMVERTMDFDINQKDRFGRTALMWAAEMNHKETVETLIDLGGDRKIVEPQGGRSALHLAARAGALDVLEVLLEDLEKPERLEYINAADKSGITPVFLAKQRSGDDGLAAFKYLMASGAKYNQQAWKEVGDLPPQPASPTKLTDLQQKQSINLKATT